MLYSEHHINPSNLNGIYYKYRIEQMIQTFLPIE